MSADAPRAAASTAGARDDGDARDAGGWERLARRAASAGAAPGSDGDLRELLVVWLDGDPYALPIERVREIVRLRPVTPMPRVPPEVRGVISLRGEIVQVIDLRCRLGLPPVDPAPGARRHRIVVLHGEDGQLCGLLVDRVSEVLRLPGEQLRATAATEADAVTALAPHGERFVSLVDVDRLLDLSRGGEGSANA